MIAVIHAPQARTAYRKGEANSSMTVENVDPSDPFMLFSGGDMNGVSKMRVDVTKSTVDKTKNLRFDRSDKPMIQNTEMLATFTGMAMDPTRKTPVTPMATCRT